MATNAQYMTLIGDDRIVSLQNLTPTDVPKTLDSPPPAGIYPNGPGTPQKGNRKVVIMVSVPYIEPADPDDFTLRLKVKVPAGALSAPGLQKFDASTPELNYLPQAKLIAQNPDATWSAAIADPTASDVAAQTVDVVIRLIVGNPSIKKDQFALFLVEVDWSHSVPN